MNKKIKSNKQYSFVEYKFYLRRKVVGSLSGTVPPLPKRPASEQSGSWTGIGR